MALEGTLRDFSLSDILQLISLQKKTGLLTLTNPDDSVILGFSEGRLVSAESSAKRIDTRLGTLLVKTRRLGADQLTRALEIQTQTLQRLGFILLRNGFCTSEDLRAGLDTQIKKIVFSIFRWTDGEYIFDQQDRIDYDHEYVVPVSIEGLLMEGARMQDEWPIIEKVVRSPDIVFQRVPSSQPVVPADEEVLDEFGESTAEKRPRERRDEPITISRVEWAIWELVDGQRTVAQIVDRTFLSEFEGAKAFFDLVSRGLIEESRSTPGRDADAATFEMPVSAPRLEGVSLAVVVALGAWLAVAVAFQNRNPLNFVTIPTRRVAVVESLQKSVSLLRLRSLAEAIDVFYLTQGKFPETTDAVVAVRLLRGKDLIDPWGRRYRYIPPADTGKYYLAGFDPSGHMDIDLFLAHHIGAGTVAPEAPAQSGEKSEVIILK